MSKYVKYKKEVSPSEASSEFVIEKNSLKRVKSEGGAQTSYNIPTELFNDMLACGALVKNTSLAYKGKKGVDLTVYELNEGFKLKLGKRVKTLLSESAIETANQLYITKGQGIKQQIRKKIYEDKNELWFVELLENNCKGVTMEYKFSEEDKTIKINICYNEIVDNFLNSIK